MASDENENEEEEFEEIEQVLFQGPMYGRDANLKKNPRLVQSALVPVKRMVSDGLSRRAHTILMEPASGRIGIRFVVDGIPYPAGAMPGQRGIAMIQMLKLLAGLDIQEKSKPQSGGITSEFEGNAYRLLLDTTPVKPGVERLRIRVVNPKDSFIRPGDVNFPDALKEKIRSYTSESSGIIIACGASGIRYHIAVAGNAALQ